MKLLIIGTGSIGTRHLRNALDLGCECWVLEPHWCRRIAAKELIREYSDRGGVLRNWDREQFDGVLVCTPWDQHLEYAQKAVAMGSALFVEKPLGSLEQIEDWRRLTDLSAKLTTQVGYQLRFHERVKQLRKWVPKPTEGTFYCLCDMAQWPGHSYGPFLLEMSHELDLMLSCGAPADLGEGIVRGERSASLSFGDERLGSRPWELEVDRGGVPVFKAYHRRWTLADRDALATVTFNSPDELGTVMYRDELLHFIECVREGKQTDVPLSDGVRVLDVIAQAMKLARAA